MWRWLAVLAPLTLAACSSQDRWIPPTSSQPTSSDQQSGCNSRIIVTFNEPLAAEPDANLVADLARVSQANVTYVTSVAPDVFVFSIAARETNADCEDAMERLRRHSRVRAVEIDTRMKHHG